MSSDIAISVKGLSKCHFIYEKPQDRLKQMLLPRLQWLLGLKPSSYGKEFWAVKDVSFEIGRGEAISIIGRNGSGKSTLLQLICGTLSPTAGEIKTFGRIAALLELGSGFNPEFSGRENIFLNASILGLSKSEIEDKLSDIVAFADIGDFIDQPVKMYSSGMVVRLAFAVIAHVDADILVVDEALAVGDMVFTQKCFRFINEFKRHKTILFVSHDAAAVANVSNKSVWMEKGVVVEIGPTREVLDSYHRTTLKTINQDVASEKKLLISDSVSNEGFWDCDFINQINTGATRSESGNVLISSSGIFNSETGEPLKILCGKTSIKINFVIDIFNDIDGLLLGFTIKDRLGQKIIEENNSSSDPFRDNIKVRRGSKIFASLTCELPALSIGGYSVDIAVAQGTQELHVTECWIYDAFQFEAMPTDAVFGLVSIGRAKFTWGHINVDSK